LIEPRYWQPPQESAREKGAERGMAEGGIPHHMRRFIIRHIDSVGELEALLLLHSEPRDWKADQVAARLYTSEAETIEFLKRLRSAGLLDCHDGVYRYDCRTGELRRMVDELAGLYGRLLIPITNLIHAKPRRIRQFADAFRFRKDR
jgi:hypothetical protein